MIKTDKLTGTTSRAGIMLKVLESSCSAVTLGSKLLRESMEFGPDKAMAGVPVWAPARRMYFGSRLDVLLLVWGNSV